MDQISLETWIPRSTVGYYVRKFNRYAKEGRPVVLPQKSGQSQNLTMSTIGKFLSLFKIFERLRNGEIEEVYYLLNIYKLIHDLKITPTQEEMEALGKALGLRS